MLPFRRNNQDQRIKTHESYFKNLPDGETLLDYFEGKKKVVLDDQGFETPDESQPVLA